MTWRFLLPFGHFCYIKLNHKQKPHSSHIFFHATVNVYILCAPPPPAIKHDDGKFMHFMLGPEEQTAQLGMPPPETADEYSPKRGIYKPTEGDIHCFFSYC